MDPFAAPGAAAAQRIQQSRRYETRDELAVLRAAAALLLDLGFTIDCAEDELGILVASKRRSAVQTGQVILAIILSALARNDVPYESHQKLRASIVTHLVGEKSTAVRATFQRVVWDSHGEIVRREALNEPEIYREFFERLERALFLERANP